MPDFSLDSPVPPKLSLAAAPSQLFQVPPTPSASSSLYRSINVSGRKRPRFESQRHIYCDSPSDIGSPVSLVNTDYHLAGGEDQPYYPCFSQPWLARREIPAELDYRPSRYREPPLPPPLDASVESLTPSEASGTCRKRSRRDSTFTAESQYGLDEKNYTGYTGYAVPEPASWSRTVVNVVGKVWDFCWSSAFRGFYAGGGRGYSMPDGVSSYPDLDQNSLWQPTLSTEKEEWVSTANFNRDALTPVPGQFPDDWVVVRGDNRDGLGNEASPSSSVTKQATRRNSVASSHSRRKSGVMMPRLKKTVLSSKTPSTPTKSQLSSLAQPHESPVSVETQRYVAEMRRREREEDASMRRLNRQLQAMIQEGKQALGTRVEVDYLDMED